MEAERPQTRVLVVDDEESTRHACASMIALWGYAVETAADGQEALDKLAGFAAHVILTDMMMPRLDGTELLRRIKAQGGGPQVIIMTAYGSIERAVAAVQDLGAFWFLEKPLQFEALRSLLERATSQTRLAERAERLERQLSYQGVLGEMVGHSEPMQTVFALVRRVAPSRAAVLLTGESGTGKELAARAIHGLSPRQSGPFVALNCAAMPDALMESELFGHEKGAFTGAVDRRSGAFELAQNGTLLLDEIGDMPAATQAKLLRVLEDGRVRRLGGKAEIQLDVRVVAATNVSLVTAIKEGKFREDLYYRLNVFPIAMPPLRDHKDDLGVLCAALIEDLNRKHSTKVTELAADVQDLFLNYAWPGNVRELRNVLERAVILAAEGTIHTMHLPPGFAGGPTAPAEAQRPGELRLPVGYTMGQAERALIELTLDYTKNNKIRTAEILGFSQKTLFNKLREYGVTLEAGPAKFPRMFVLMPFDEVLRPVFEDHIKRTAAALGLSCGRADDLFTAGPIIQDIREAINEADVIVADCTGRNANVFYEIGIAHTLRKDTILIAQTLDDVPFDLRHIRVIHYHYTPHGMSEFEDQLKKTVLAVLPARRQGGAAS